MKKNLFLGKINHEETDELFRNISKKESLLDLIKTMRDPNPLFAVAYSSLNEPKLQAEIERLTLKRHQIFSRIVNSYAWMRDIPHNELIIMDNTQVFRKF